MVNKLHNYYVLESNTFHIHLYSKKNVYRILKTIYSRHFIVAECISLELILLNYMYVLFNVATTCLSIQESVIECSENKLSVRYLNTRITDQVN